MTIEDAARAYVKAWGRYHALLAGAVRRDDVPGADEEALASAKVSEDFALAMLVRAIAEEDEKEDE